MKVIEPENLGYPIFLYGDEMVYFQQQLLENVFLNTMGEKKMIITDQGVYNHYSGVIDRLCLVENVFLYIIDSGEGSKSLIVAEKIWSVLASEGFHRNDTLLAFGGGVVGDLTGFVASNYMRGIKWIQIPTTLLAQIDSSVGGKVAINLPEAKNLIGQFYNPRSVWICTSFLSTLESNLFRDGLGEIFKYGYMADPSLLSILDKFKNIESIRDTDQGKILLLDLIDKCLSIKIAVVLKDFNELNERRFLNLGHSFGHAIESYTKYNISHGHAVMLGIEWILKCSYLLESKAVKGIMVDEGILNNTYEMLSRKHLERMFKYGFDNPAHLRVTDLLPYLMKDKKVESLSISLILLNLRKIAFENQEEVLLNGEQLIASISERCYIYKWLVADLEIELSH